MTRIALGVQYDGRAYCGWQVQPNQPTVQAVLDSAICQFIGNGQAVRVTAAGRTDFLSFARLYFIPVKHHELPKEIRLAPIW